MQGNRVTATIEVSWNLDLVPGWNHTPEDMLDHIRAHLVNTVDHYNPEVRLVSGPRPIIETPASQ